MRRSAVLQLRIDRAAGNQPSLWHPPGRRRWHDAALAATINAVVDALSEFGVRHVEMPATSERVWRAIQEARAHNML